jgi:hypothetical protein
MDLATAIGNESFVTLKHGGNLLALIGMDQKYDFIMTH